MVKGVRFVLCNNRSLSIQGIDLNNGLEGTQQHRKEKDGALGEEAASRDWGSIEYRAND